jgi:hypothetical protein
VPPLARPFPRFLADSPQEPAPYGDWGTRLAAAFADACEPLVTEAGSAVDPETLRWFPERTWGGRVYVPASARAAEPSADGVLCEYYGHVSFVRPEDGEPGDIRAWADFTDVTAEDNPDWQMDLNDDVIGAWRAERGRGGEVTLVWGTPFVRGALAVTAELGGDVVDQAAVVDGRFTLIGVDAVTGFGDDHYMTVRLWDRRLRELASESLYEEAGEEPGVAPEAD